MPVKRMHKHDLMRIPLVALNKERSGLRHGVHKFRVALEAEVCRRGPVTVLQASRVHTALTALRRHLRVERILATVGDKLSYDQWLSYAKESVAFKWTVDKTLVALGLDRDATEDLINALYSPLPASNGSEAVSEAQDAAQGECQLAKGKE